MKEKNNAAWESHEKILNDKIFLIVLIIALLAFAYRVFVYDQYFNPDTLFLKADKVMSNTDAIKIDDKIIKFNIVSRIIKTERAEDEYTDTKEVLLLNDAGREIGKAKLSKLNGEDVIRVFKNEFKVELLNESAKK
ncbi:MAG: hypothetical protein ACLU2L_02025 [Fenollaria timonensis]